MDWVSEIKNTVRLPNSKYSMITKQQIQYDYQTANTVRLPNSKYSMITKQSVKNQITTNLDDSHSIKSLLQRAFLDNGNLRSPDEKGGGYYFEVSFKSEATAKAVAEDLNSFDIKVKQKQSGESYTLYSKDGESISNLLAYIDAPLSALELQQVLLIRSEINNSNRRANCYSKNADKTAEACVKQVLAIESIMSNPVTFNLLTEDLKKTAEARLEYKNVSIKELADILGVSKSCVQHRLNKLVGIEI